MGRMISFRDLIGLEPKPKKVKYFDDTYYFDNGYTSKKYNCLLENVIDFTNMTNPNIEIIEADVEKTNEYYYTNDTRYNELVDEVMYLKDYINKKEGK